MSKFLQTLTKPENIAIQAIAVAFGIITTIAIFLSPPLALFTGLMFLATEAIYTFKVTVETTINDVEIVKKNPEKKPEQSEKVLSDDDVDELLTKENTEIKLEKERIAKENLYKLTTITYEKKKGGGFIKIVKLPEDDKPSLKINDTESPLKEKKHKTTFNLSKFASQTFWATIRVLADPFANTKTEDDNLSKDFTSKF